MDKCARIRYLVPENTKRIIRKSKSWETVKYNIGISCIVTMVTEKKRGVKMEHRERTIKEAQENMMKGAIAYLLRRKDYL